LNVRRVFEKMAKLQGVSEVIPKKKKKKVSGHVIGSIARVL
jgi:hypothetical protein